MEIVKDLDRRGMDQGDETITELAISVESRAVNPGVAEEEETINSGTGGNLFKYVRSLGIKKDSALILSSEHHYYYEEGDLKNVSALINLKPLNYIYDLKSLLRSVHRLLPKGSSFIGYYQVRNSIYTRKNDHPIGIISDFRSKTNDSGTIPRFSVLSRMYSYFDTWFNGQHSDRTISRLFMMNGFRIADMTVIDGCVYFVAKHLTVYEA
jgi:hypothetical protein